MSPRSTTFAPRSTRSVLQAAGGLAGTGGVDLSVACGAGLAILSLLMSEECRRAPRTRAAGVLNRMFPRTRGGAHAGACSSPLAYALITTMYRRHVGGGNGPSDSRRWKPLKLSTTSMHRRWR